MGWQDAPIVQAAPKREAWEDAPVVVPSRGPKYASGISEALSAGYQGSLAGLADRGRLPDIVLDPHNSKWYERLAAGAAQLFNEIPESIAGAAAGAPAGAAVGGVAGTVFPVVGNVVGAGVGGVIGAGAGAMAVPAAIRQSLIESYSKGAVQNSADFLDRTTIVLKQAGKEGLIGAVTAGAGKAASVGAATMGLGAKATAAATLGAEGTSLVVTPAALEGRLPEPQDFMDAAILIGGLKGATGVAGKLREVYAKTGKTPLEVMADAKADPTIAADLKGEPETFYHGTNSKFNNFDTTRGSTPGSWFTKDKHAAAQFGEVSAFTLDIKNPATMADLAKARQEVVKAGLDALENPQAFNSAVIQNLEAKGFDGIRDPNFKGAGGAGDSVAAVFRPEQIKPKAAEPAAAKTEPTKAAEPAYDPEARVSVQAFDAETGAMTETSMLAKDALSDNAKRREQMEGLLKCLGA